MSLLKGKSIIVTGAGRGLGRAYARDAAAQGANVLVNDIDEDKAIEVAETIRARGGSAIPSGGSVASLDDAQSLIEHCLRSFSGLDCLVNNAGLFHVVPCWDEKEDAVQRTVAVNLVGAIFMGTQCYRTMKRLGGGSIVNVASVVEMGMYGSSTYGATKGAIASLTYCWAALGAADGIRVNAVSPRASTRMVVANGRAFDEANPAIPPDLTGPLVSYLLSDEAATVTGQVFRLQVDTLAVLRRPRPVEPVVDVPAWSAETSERALVQVMGEGQRAYGWRDPLA